LNILLHVEDKFTKIQDSYLRSAAAEHRAATKKIRRPPPAKMYILINFPHARTPPKHAELLLASRRNGA
jgi:hypothetical protein